MTWYITTTHVDAHNKALKTAKEALNNASTLELGVKVLAETTGSDEERLSAALSAMLEACALDDYWALTPGSLERLTKQQLALLARDMHGVTVSAKSKTELIKNMRVALKRHKATDTHHRQ